MAGNQAVVEFLLKWSESGGQLPEKVKRDLDRMGQSGSQAGSITDRLGDAFTRLEKREPTMVLRRARVAMEDLGAEALDATGPLGRFAVSLASLAPGGTVGAGAIAGTVAIGFEIKKLIDLSGELEKQMGAATDSIAHFGGAGATAWVEVRKLREQIESISQETGIFGGTFTIFGGLAEGERTTRATRLATAQTGEELDMRAIHHQHAETIRRHNEELQQTGEKAARETQRAFDEMTKTIVANLQRQRDIFLRFPERLAVSTQPPPALFGPSKFRLNQVRDPRTGKFLYPDQTEYAANIDQGGREPTDSNKQDPSAIVAATFGLLASARGGAGGALAGLGGLLGSIKGVNPVIGTVLQGFGGLVSLFSGGQAKVTISRLEEQALEQMRSVQRTPQAFSVNVIGAGDRATKYRQGRLTQLDAVTRGVT